MSAAAPTATTSLRHPLPQALLVLTFTTGIVDAVSYLGLGHVFTANMTGNVVLLGFGIAGTAGLPIAGPFASLGAYLLGAIAGGRIARRIGKERLLTTALALEVILLAVTAVLAATATITDGAAATYVLIVLLAFTMGLRSACIRRLGASDISTVVLTMLMVDLASESTFAGGSGVGTVRRSSAVVLMGAGALTGALLLHASVWLPVAIAAGLALLVREAYRKALI
jgi:uncharacterized membrane protein YoaK (UPF0700 family)